MTSDRIAGLEDTEEITCMVCNSRKDKVKKLRLSRTFDGENIIVFSICERCYCEFREKINSTKFG